MAKRLSARWPRSARQHHPPERARYISFRSYLPAQDAVQRFGVKFGRMAQIHFDALGQFRDSRVNNLHGGELASFMPPPGGGDGIFADSVSMFVGENPDIDFLHDERVIP